MKTERKKEIRSRQEKAMKGPWICFYTGLGDVTRIYSVDDSVVCIIEDEGNASGEENSTFNFIANAYQDIPDLLDTVEEDDIIKRDLAMLVKRLCNGSACVQKALDYLSRKGLAGTILRKEDSK